MLRPDTIALTALLALLSGLNAFSTDSSLPSLPDIAQSLSASGADVQLTISCYLVGSAIGTIFWGPIADRFGRKPTLLAALVIYCIASAVCAAAPNIQVLVAARIIQALGPCGTTVVARAVVRDLYNGPRLARQMAGVTAAMSIAPLIAPLVGGAVQTAFGWRPVFGLSLGIGLFAGVMVWLFLAESLRQRAPEPISVPSMVRTYRSLLRTKSYVAYIALLSLNFAGLITWIASASLVLQNLYGLTPLQFSFVFVVGTLGYVSGAWLSGRVGMRYGVDITIGIGTTVQAFGGFLMLLGVIAGVSSAAALVVPMGLYLMGSGVIYPNAYAGSLSPFPDRAGAAAALVSFVQQLFGAAVAALIGSLLGPSALPLGIAIALAGCSTFTVWATTRRIRADAALSRPAG